MSKKILGFFSLFTLFLSMIATGGLDIGEQRIHVYGHDWPATDNIAERKWK